MTTLVPKPQDKSTALEQPEPQQFKQPEPESGHKSKLPLLILTGVLIAGIAAPTWYFLSLPQNNALQVSGRIEGYETDVGAKIAGRVNFVAVREGDRVRQGQIIVKLDALAIDRSVAKAAAIVPPDFSSRIKAGKTSSVQVQTLANKQLIFILIFPVTIQLLVFGFALSPDVNHLKLGIVD